MNISAGSKAIRLFSSSLVDALVNPAAPELSLLCLSGSGLCALFPAPTVPVCIKNSTYLQFQWNDIQSAHRSTYFVLKWSFLCTARTVQSVQWLGHLDNLGTIPGRSKRFFSSLKCPYRLQVPPTLLFSLCLGRVKTVKPHCRDHVSSCNIYI